jgi:hypothetical protein
VGHVLFVVVVSSLTTIWALQIIRQLTVAQPAPGPVQCRPGVRALIDSVRQARHAAREAGGGEVSALARFRSTLGPAWKSRDELAAMCRDDREAGNALREVDLWRYAEENAVRYEAAELNARRKAVRSLEARLFGADQGGKAPAPALSCPAPDDCHDE